MKDDIFTLLEGGRLPNPAQASLPVLSLWQLATYYLTFFTLVPAKYASHYDDDAGHYVCLGDKCPACAAGVRATEHIYLPVWDAQNRRVAVLKFDTRPDGPAATVLTFLKTYKDQLADVVAVITCEGKGKFAIVAHRPLPETDRGALACEEFCRGLEAGTISLRSCVKNLAAADIVKLASVKCRATPVVGGVVAPVKAEVSVVVGDAVPPPGTAVVDGVVPPPANPEEV
jgi:hypothetical protein